MKSYIRILSAVFVLIFAFCAVGVCSVSAEGEYTQPEKFIYGDVNQDGAVTVKDVTYIQKGLANLTYVTAVQRFLADPDGEGYSIKNATAIQKYLAKYEVSDLLGTELIMASQDEFSKRIPGDIQVYYGDSIMISPKTNNSIEYTIYDFAEYEFSSIEKINEGVEEGYSGVYILYLNNCSKANVADAIKALDYRANIDLEFVYVNRISLKDAIKNYGATFDSPMVFDSEDSVHPVNGKNIEFVQTISGAYDSNVADDYFRGSRFLVYTDYNQDIEKLAEIEGEEFAEKYNEKYFVDNVLIIMCHVGSSDKKYRVNSVCVNNETMGINYTTLIPDGGAICDDVVKNRVYIEIRKDDMVVMSDILTYHNFDVY